MLELRHDFGVRPASHGDLHAPRVPETVNVQRTVDFARFSHRSTNLPCPSQPGCQPIDGLIQLASFPGLAISIVRDCERSVGCPRHERRKPRIFTLVAQDLLLFGHPEQASVGCTVIIIAGRSGVKRDCAYGRASKTAPTSKGDGAGEAWGLAGNRLLDGGLNLVIFPDRVRLRQPMRAPNLG